MGAGDAALVPTKNAAWRVTFPIFDADGDLVAGAVGLDSERSLDGGAFADLTAEAIEIAANSGMYYLDLNASEMNADTVAIIVKTTTPGAKTTPIVAYPGVGGFDDILSDTAAIESELILVHSETTIIQVDADNAYSDTTVIEAWGLSATASDAAAVESELILVHSETTIIASDVILIYSDTTIVVSDTTVIEAVTAIVIADAVLSRGVANVEDAADTTSLAAVVLATLESSVAGVVWTIRKTGGAAFVVKTVTLDAAADPIVGVT